MEEIQICKLCEQPKKLIQAHIIPKWAFKYLKQDNHFFQINGGTKSRKLQDGYKDSSLLCHTCDNEILGKYDTYAKKFFDQDFQSQIIHKTTPKGVVAFIELTKFDYVKLKLFLLSVLWRSSITKHNKFSVVKLGKYEDVIKNMLLKGIINNEKLFQIVLATWEHPKNAVGYEKSILFPFKRKINGIKCYSFIIAGFEIITKVGQEELYLFTKELNMKPEGFFVLVTSFDKSTMGKVTRKIKEAIRKKRGFI